MNSIKQLQLAGQLPSPKGVALAIMQISQREDAVLGEVAKVVQTDPALSSRLLRLANSAANSGRTLVSIEEAVMRLGMKTVRQLATGFSLVDQYTRGPCEGFDYPGFWSHSLLVAVASQELGKAIRAGAPDELFSCGLLAQIGELAMATVYPAEYTAILKQKTSGEALRALEREHLEVDHIEFTAAILEDCRIPSALSEPITYHEAPEKSGYTAGSRPYQLAYMFFQARRIADLAMTSEIDRHNKIAELMRLGGQIGLDADAFGELFDRVVNEWQEWGKLFKVPAATLPTFATMAKAPAPRLNQEISTACQRVLVVDDDPISRNIMETALRHLLGCTIYTAENGKDALAKALEIMPQIVITDWVMPTMDGIDLCRALRATEWGQSMYVIMLTSMESDENITEAFEAGVDDYLTKPVNLRALKARMRAALHYVGLLEIWEKDRAQLKQFAAELAISNRRLEQAAMTDLLTGLPNRRAGMDDLDKVWSASERTTLPVALLLIDIDAFKSINDQYGHAVGDIALQKVAGIIQASARNHDRACRMGGEEFLLICYNTTASAALLIAERLRKTIKALTIKVGDVDIQTSVSIGIAERAPGMQKVGDLVLGADKALYTAKHAGKDRVCLFGNQRS